MTCVTDIIGVTVLWAKKVHTCMYVPKKESPFLPPQAELFCSQKACCWTQLNELRRLTHVLALHEPRVCFFGRHNILGRHIHMCVEQKWSVTYIRRHTFMCVTHLFFPNWKELIALPIDPRRLHINAKIAVTHTAWSRRISIIPQTIHAG